MKQLDQLFHVLMLCVNQSRKVLLWLVLLDEIRLISSSQLYRILRLVTVDIDRQSKIRQQA